ncbi:hypothetical protein Tsubulata_029687, partial [Turnera subulata]
MPIFLNFADCLIVVLNVVKGVGGQNPTKSINFHCRGLVDTIRHWYIHCYPVIITRGGPLNVIWPSLESDQNFSCISPRTCQP